MTKVNSIKEVFGRSEDPQKRRLQQIHSFLDDKNYVEVVLLIAEYGYMSFFQDYRRFLGSSHLGNLYWEEAFDVFISPRYSQLWRGLERPQREKTRKSKYEWFDKLMLGQNY